MGHSHQVKKISPMPKGIGLIFLKLRVEEYGFGHTQIRLSGFRIFYTAL